MTAVGPLRLRRLALALLAPLVTAVALACGPGAQAPNGTPAPAESPVPAPTGATEVPVETATQAAQPTEAPRQTPTAESGGADAPYLRALCTAGDDLQRAILAAAVRLETGAADPDDPEAFATLLAEPVGAFLKAMGDVAPPADLAEYHALALARYETLAELLASMEESGGIDDPLALFGVLEAADDAPAVPEETLARLARVASEIPECANSLVLASFLGQQNVSVPAGADVGTAAGADPVTETYVRQLCLAGDVFEATYEVALAGLGDGTELDEDDPAVFAAVFREALRGLAADLVLIAPPDEVAGSHAAAIGLYEEMVSVLDSITGALEAGAEPATADLVRFQELLQGGSAMPGLPPAEANRLGQAANHVPECFGSGFLLGFLSARP